MTREEEITKEAKAFADGQCEALIKPEDCIKQFKQAMEGE